MKVTPVLRDWTLAAISHRTAVGRRMMTLLLAAVILDICAPVALTQAQSVEFRIVERTGRSIVTGPSDAPLNLAVQARVSGYQTVGLVQFGFNIHIVGESDHSGSLARGLISNPDHTYSSAIGVSNTVGQGGLASQYSALASINPVSNGLINASDGTFTHGPDQEVGLIAGKLSGPALLATPGIDTDGDGNPDTWPANNSGHLPGSGTTALVSPTVADVFLGAHNRWADVYRFQYTPADLSTRTLVFRLENLTASVAWFLLCDGSGVWGTGGDYAPSTISSAAFTIGVASPAAGSCCNAAGSCSIVTAGGCSGTFRGLVACEPGSCIASVFCCDVQTGVCASVFPADCSGTIMVAGSCSPSPCPLVPCCGSNGYCYVVPLSVCGVAGRTGATSCTPDPCPTAVPCCEPRTGTCELKTPSRCLGLVLHGTACPSVSCVPASACCNLQTGTCTVLAPMACNGAILAAATCSPSPCGLVPCCDTSGRCFLATLSTCSGTPGSTSSCVPNLCSQYTPCCDRELGTCRMVTGSECNGTLSIAATCSPNPCSSTATTALATEFRIVERTGRTIVTNTSDAQLDFAVQARVVGGSPTSSLSGFSITIQIIGEHESAGVLARGLISNPDGTYASAIGISSTIGRGGLAAQFSYLAGFTPPFNGSINISSGTFVNTPDQEIGLITGYSSPLIAPGVDADGDGNPDTWTGNGSGAPPDGATAPMDPAVAAAYFGAGANWIDIYRFRYTVRTFTPRTLRFHLRDVSSMNFSRLNYGTYWTMDHPTNSGAFPADAAVGVASVPSGVCCDVGTGACSVFIPGECNGSFLPAAACSPSPCPSPGRCCSDVGVCSWTPQATCVGIWTSGGACVPNPCPNPGACCFVVSPTGFNYCRLSLQTSCNGPWAPGTCTPDCGPLWGACCSPDHTCTLVYDNACAFIWSPHTTCQSNCPPLGRCCDRGTCSITSQGTCPLYAVVVGGTCSPNPCNPGGRCCQVTGGCTIAEQTWCYGTWTVNETCSPAPCPPAGRCCSAAGDCTFIVQTSCIGFWTVNATCEFPCPRPGRCCALSGACSMSLLADCRDTWSVEATCTSNPCDSLGACCQGGACAMTTGAGCAPANGSTFHGFGTVCGSVTNPIACCPANFNRVSGVNVQDVFDFLSAWFASDPASDFNGANGLTHQDILDFLNSWFAGC